MSYLGTFPTNLPKYSRRAVAVTVAVVSNDYPLHVIPAGAAAELCSKASGITSQNTAINTQEFPRYMVIRDRASELRSKITI
jgi:hypothetical protein